MSNATTSGRTERIACSITRAAFALMNGRATQIVVRPPIWSRLNPAADLSTLAVRFTASR